MIWNIGSTFNTLYLGQANYQGASNTAWNSPAAYQGIGQAAGNGATVIQLG
jgi:hypothetical protein